MKDLTYKNPFFWIGVLSLILGVLIISTAQSSRQKQTQVVSFKHFSEDHDLVRKNIVLYCSQGYSYKSYITTCNPRDSYTPCCTTLIFER